MGAEVPNITVGLFSSLFNSVSFCFMHFGTIFNYMHMFMIVKSFKGHSLSLVIAVSLMSIWFDIITATPALLWLLFNIFYFSIFLLSIYLCL